MHELTTKPYYLLWFDAIPVDIFSEKLGNIFHIFRRRYAKFFRKLLPEVFQNAVAYRKSRLTHIHILCKQLLISLSCQRNFAAFP